MPFKFTKPGCVAVFRRKWIAMLMFCAEYIGESAQIVEMNDVLCSPLCAWMLCHAGREWFAWKVGKDFWNMSRNCWEVCAVQCSDKHLRTLCNHFDNMLVAMICSIVAMMENGRH